MDYSKYSRQAFEALIPGSAELNRLVTDLKKDINLALHAAVHEKFEEIASSLNGVGHHLEEDPRSRVGELDFTQVEDERHIFYICCDTVISSGYRDTSGYVE